MTARRRRPPPCSKGAGGRVRRAQEIRPHVDQGLAFRLTSGHMTGHSIVRSGSAICRVPTPTHPVDPTVRGWRQRVSIGPHCEQDGGRASPRSLHMDTFPVRTFMRHASWAAPAEIAYGPSRCASAIDTFIPTSTPTRTNATPIATVFSVMSFPHVFRHASKVACQHEVGQKLRRRSALGPTFGTNAMRNGVYCFRKADRVTHRSFGTPIGGAAE